MAVQETEEFEGIHYPNWHGSPFDRGGADSWYDRGEQPHYYPNGTGNDPRIVPPQMKEAEIKAYLAGYKRNELSGGKKDW